MVISEYKNILEKSYTPKWSQEVFMIIKVKNTVPWISIINNLNREEIVGRFYENELLKTNQQELRIEKVFRRKDHKLYVYWEEYNNSFNSYIDRK